MPLYCPWSKSSRSRGRRRGRRLKARPDRPASRRSSPPKSICSFALLQFFLPASQRFEIVGATLTIALMLGAIKNLRAGLALPGADSGRFFELGDRLGGPAEFLEAAGLHFVVDGDDPQRDIPGVRTAPRVIEDGFLARLGGAVAVDALLVAAR